MQGLTRQQGSRSSLTLLLSTVTMNLSEYPHRTAACGNKTNDMSGLRSLAIARVFGGFPQSFYETYFKNHPKSEPQEEYPVRAELYESFHYLNHTVIFGVSSQPYA